MKTRKSRNKGRKHRPSNGAKTHQEVSTAKKETPNDSENIESTADAEKKALPQEDSNTPGQTPNQFLKNRLTSKESIFSTAIYIIRSIFSPGVPKSKQASHHTIVPNETHLDLQNQKKGETTRVLAVKSKGKKTALSILNRWPFYIWVVMAAGAYFIHLNYISQTIVPGIVEDASQTITAPLDGRVSKIHFAEWSEVKEGDLVVTLQSDKLDADVEKLETKLRMRQEDLYQVYYEGIQKLDRSILNYELEIIDIHSENRSISGQIDEFSAFQTPSNEALVVPRPLKGVTEKISKLKSDLSKNMSKISKNEHRISAAGVDIEKINQKVRNLQDKEFIDMANLEEEISYANLLERREGLAVKANCSGKISSIPIQEGMSIDKSDELLIVVPRPDGITCRIPKEKVGQFKVGQTVWVTDRNQGKPFEVEISAMSPNIEKDVLGGGRNVYLRYPQDSHFIAGQEVAVQLNDPSVSMIDNVKRRLSQKSSTSR